MEHDKIYTLKGKTMDAAAFGWLLGSAERDMQKNLNSMKKSMENEMAALRTQLADQQRELIQANNRQNQPEPVPRSGNYPRYSTVSYNWKDPEFQSACAAIRDDFYARHPERVRGDGSFARDFPHKIKAVEVLDRMSGLDRIHPDEYVLLYKEIYNF